MADDQTPCPVCGWTKLDWKKKHRMGCDHCYTHWAEDLLRWYQKRGFEYPYSGPLPMRFEELNRKRRHRDGLKQKLEQCLKSENYEEAAQIRDQIRTMSLELEELK